MAHTRKKPRINEMVDNLSEMSKIFFQVIILIDCLDRLVETETSSEKIKSNIKSFVTDLERLVKDYTSYEMELTSYFKDDDNLDFSNIILNEDTKKDKDASLNIARASTSISLRPQTSKSKTIFAKIMISPYREIMKLHGETMERLFGLTDSKEMIVDKSGIHPRIHFLQGANLVEIRDLVASLPYT